MNILIGRKMHKEFVRLLREKVDEGLSEKTNWGRNDVKKIIEKAISDTALEILDEVIE